MTKTEQITKCNNALRREFGEVDGLPRFKWFHSEDKALMISMRKIDPENGQPIYDYQQDAHTLLVKPMPVFIRRKLCLTLHNQFVLCKFVPTCSASDFNAKFGNMLEYPSYGIWQPITPTALKPNILPNMEVTGLLISAVKEEFETKDAMLADLPLEAARLEAQEKANRRMKMREALPAFGMIPGTKSHTSFGGIENPSITGVIQ